MSIFNDENFDTTKYINTTYNTSSVYEIQDGLVNTRKSISETQLDSKNLVAQHFDKFIECRSVIDSIHTNIKNNSFLKKFNSNLDSKISKVNVAEYDIINQQNEVRKKLYKLFDLENDLKTCTSYEQFVYLNKNAFKVKSKVYNSDYIEKKWNETDVLRLNFLNKMVDEIENKENSFNEMTHFFDMYFEISKIRNLKTSDNERFKKERIENTIYLNIKAEINSIFESSDIINSIEECKFIIKKVFKYDFRHELKEEIIKNFTDCILNRLNNQNEVVLRMINKELEDICIILSKSSESTLKYNCLKMIDNVEDKILEITIYSAIKDTTERVDDFCLSLEEKLEKCVEMTGKRKCEKIKKITNKVINTKIADNNIEDVKYIKNVFVDKSAKILDQKISDFIETFDILRKKEKENMDNVIEKIKAELREIKVKSMGVKNRFEIEEFIVPEIMMVILRIIDEYSLNYRSIIKKVKSEIEDNVCLFYLKDILGIKNLELLDEEKVLFERYKKAFGFLMNEKYDVFDEKLNKIEDDLRSLKIDEKKPESIKNLQM